MLYFFFFFKSFFSNLLCHISAQQILYHFSCQTAQISCRGFVLWISLRQRRKGSFALSPPRHVPLLQRFGPRGVIIATSAKFLKENYVHCSAVRREPISTDAQWVCCKNSASILTLLTFEDPSQNGNSEGLRGWKLPESIVCSEEELHRGCGFVVVPPHPASTP